MKFKELQILKASLGELEKVDCLDKIRVGQILFFYNSIASIHRDETQKLVIKSSPNDIQHDG